MDRTPCRLITRRRFVALTGAFGATALLAACGDSDSASTGERAGEAMDFEAHFAGFPLADEPDGDLAMVTWPAFVTAAPPEIRDLYAFHVTSGDLMRYMPCFCGCNGGSGHLNNRDCYIQAVHPDGSVTFDSMAPT